MIDSRSKTSCHDSDSDSEPEPNEDSEEPEEDSDIGEIMSDNDKSDYTDGEE